jgi:2'-5' RNA ligase
MQPNNESAIIIPIPEVESVVGGLRLQYDPVAHLGVPAHITLLYPFCVPQALAREIKILREVCESITSFAFSFTEVRRFPATAYLHPDKPEVFTQITRTLMEKWPECKPYGGAFADVVPHLTVADRVHPQTLSVVEEYLRCRLPIRCVAREIWVLASDDAGMWTKRASLPLATPKRR